MFFIFSEFYWCGSDFLMGQCLWIFHKFVKIIKKKPSCFALESVLDLILTLNNLVDF